jgi:hypothetical protein
MSLYILAAEPDDACITPAKIGTISNDTIFIY